MFNELYLIADMRIKHEIEHLVASDSKYEDTYLVFFDPLAGGKDTELATFIENAIVDDNVLLICEVSSPDMQLPEGYFTYAIEHRLDHLYELFIDRSVIGEHLDAGALIVTPGYTDWLCSVENVVNGSPLIISVRSPADIHIYWSSIPGYILILMRGAVNFPRTLGFQLRYRTVELAITAL